MATLALVSKVVRKSSNLLCESLVSNKNPRPQAWGVVKIIMNRDHVVEVKKCDEPIRKFNLLSDADECFIEKIKSLNKIQIRKALGYSTFMDKNTEYINKKHLYKQLEGLKETKEKKAFFSSRVLNSFVVSTWLFVLFFGPVSMLALVLISVFDVLIYFSVDKKIASIRSCAHNLGEFMSENHFEDSYVRWGDIEYKLHETYLGKHIDEIYRYIHGPIKGLLSSGSDFKETKEEPIVEDNDNILYIENKYNIEELNETNVLIKEIQDKGLNIENKTLLEHQIPTLKKHLENFNIMDASNKELLIKSISLLNIKLKNILNDCKKEENMELSADIQALYNSLL